MTNTFTPARVTVGHVCGNVGTIDPYVEYFSSDDAKDLSAMAQLVSAKQTAKHYYLFDPILRLAVSAVVGQPLPRDAFVWFE